MKILCTVSTFNEDLFPKEIEVIYNPLKRKLNEQEVIELILSIKPVGIIAGVEPLTNNVLKHASELRVISRCGSGMDSIDLVSAENFGIKVLNTPDAATIAVAELTIALILGNLRQIHISDSSIRNGEWIRPMGYLLNNKTVGIIGCGRIGTYVATLLKSFGCRILGYDKHLENHNIIDITSLDHLLRESDIITLHMPYSSENHNFFGSVEMEKMKSNSFIINTSRGNLLDEDALYVNLVNGKIKGASLDCFEQEPYIGKLASLKNVFLTAHIGSYAVESRELQEQQAVDNLLNELNYLGLI